MAHRRKSHLLWWIIGLSAAVFVLFFTDFGKGVINKVKGLFTKKQ
jgi:hypothetical protein